MDLIRLSQAGNPTTFAELFEKYKNLVYRTAFLMLDDPDEAEDVLQEVFIRVHRSLDSYRPEKGAFTTWLHRVTVNHCLNLKRSHPLAIIPIDSLALWKGSTKEPSIEERVSNEEELRLALQKLSPKLRAVIVLRYYWDLSYGDMAQVLDIPVGTVQSRLNQALSKLRKHIHEPVDDSLDMSLLEENEARSQRR